MGRGPLVVALAIGLAGCAEDAPRDPTERRNVAALETIPLPPGARIGDTRTVGEYAPGRRKGHIAGWTTHRFVWLSRELPAGQAVARVRGDLTAADWQITGGSTYTLNARRGPSCLHLVLTGRNGAVREIDIGVTDCTRG